MSAILALIWANRQWIAYLLVALAIAGAIFRFGSVRYAAGEAAGRAHVQALWDDQQAAQAKAVEAQARAVAAQIEKDRKVAQEVDRVYRERTQAADSIARDTARRLHDAQARARRCAVSGAASSPRVVAPPGGESADGATLDRLDEDHHAACAHDAQTVNAWFDWCDGVKCWEPMGR